MLDALRRRRLALFALMFIVGLGMASWVVRTPAVRDALSASTGTMGIVLLGLSVGSMLGVLSSGPLVARFGARPIVLLGSVLVVLGIAVVGVASQLMLTPGVFVGLLVFGIGGGVGEIGLNVEGAAIESLMRRPVLPMLHGSFSLGTVIGASAGLWLTAIDFSVFWHLTSAAVVMAAIASWAIPSLPAATGQTRTRRPSERLPLEPRRSVWRDRQLILFALIVLAMAFAEGSANDWLPLLMVDGHGMSAAHGSLVYVGFAVMMTVGRFAGGPVVERFGRMPVLRASALIAIVGVLTVIISPNAVMAGFAAVLWGLGASLGFPVAISAAGDNADRSAQRVSAVASSGYVAFLVGPPLLGFVGEQVGLRQAMLVVVAFLIVAVLAASSHPRRPLAEPL